MTGRSSAISRRRRIAAVISLSHRWWAISRTLHWPGMGWASSSWSWTSPMAASNASAPTAYRATSAARSSWGMVMSLSPPGDGLDLDQAPLGQGRDLDRRARGRRVRHEAAVHGVHRREVADVREEDRGLDDVGPGETGRVQHGSEVAQRSLGLRLDALHELAGRRVQPQLAAAEQEPVDGDGLAVRADRGGRAGGGGGPAGPGPL